MSKETVIVMLAISHPVAMCVMFWFGREIGELRERDHAEGRRMEMAEKIQIAWELVARTGRPFLEAYESIDDIEKSTRQVHKGQEKRR